MLTRFCLYGFLKNQQYFEPFLWLALLAKGLSFTQIGLLVGFREICINLLEAPTGAIADVLGRRRSMVASMLAYMGAFAVFAAVDTLWPLFAAMALFAVGEAFRTGTHKAIIFDWLAHENRANEKTTIYGLTRSWSKLGSALSAIIAAAVVYFTENYAAVFLTCLIPYGLNVVNLATYPTYLDGPKHDHQNIGQVLRTLGGAIKTAWLRRPLRRLLIESMGFEGLFRTTKDFIQPILKAAVIAVPIATALSDRKRTAAAIAIVYVAIYLLSSLASRHAGRFVERLGGERRAGRALWLGDLVSFGLLAVGLALGRVELMVVAFVMLAVAQNFWRPILVSRCASLCEANHTATVLSIESQAKSLFLAIVAPLLGLAVDVMTPLIDRTEFMTEWWRFAPLAVIGILLPVGMLLTMSRAKPQALEGTDA